MTENQQLQEITKGQAERKLRKAIADEVEKLDGRIEKVLEGRPVDGGPGAILNLAENIERAVQYDTERFLYAGVLHMAGDGPANAALSIRIDMETEAIGRGYYLQSSTSMFANATAFHRQRATISWLEDARDLLRAFGRDQAEEDEILATLKAAAGEEA